MNKMKGKNSKQLYWNTWRQQTAILALSVPLTGIIAYEERRYVMPESHSESVPIEPNTLAPSMYANTAAVMISQTGMSTYRGLTPVVLPPKG